MPAKKTAVNLLPPSEFETTFWGRFLKWAVTTGRYVIILTELVVIMAFLSRFKLDEDLRTLNSEIRNKKTILEHSAGFESEFRAVQKKTLAIESMLDSQWNANEELLRVAENTPEEVKIASLTLDREKINITGLAPNEKALGGMISFLNSVATWKDVELASVIASAEKGINFYITITR